VPVVLTDKTNKVWTVEDPVSGFVLAGYTGQPGPRLLDLLDFVAIREKQFIKFVEKRREQEEEDEQRRRALSKSANV